jgi:hypothetical protein
MHVDPNCNCTSTGLWFDFIYRYWPLNYDQEKIQGYVSIGIGTIITLEEF